MSHWEDQFDSWAEKYEQHTGIDADSLDENPEYLLAYQSGFGMEMDDDEWEDMIIGGQLRSAGEDYYENGQLVGHFLADYLDYTSEKIDEYFGYSDDN